MPSKKTMVIVWATALLCGAAGVCAQPIVKQSDANGHITYTNRPEPGAFVLARQAAFPESIEEQPRERVAQTATVNQQLGVERALKNMATMSSARTATIDAIETAARIRREQQDASGGAGSSFAMPVVNDGAAAGSGAGNPGPTKPTAGGHDNMARLIVSILIYLVSALALGCIVFVSLRIVLTGALPGLRQTGRQSSQDPAAP